MRVTPTLTNVIIAHEGLRLTPYFDTVGVPTVGYGHNLRKGFTPHELALLGVPAGLDERALLAHLQAGISIEAAQCLLTNDIAECLIDLATFPWFARMNHARQIAVCDWRFNLGATRFRKWKPTIAFLERDDYPGAARQFRTNTKYFRQVKGRADWIARVIETGLL